MHFSIIFFIFIIGFAFTDAGAETLDIALICAKQQCWNPVNDQGLKEYLKETLGHNVKQYDDDDGTIWNVTAYDAVIISPSVDSPNVGWLYDKEVGILTTLASTNNEFWLSDYGNIVVGGSTDVFIKDDSHYITQQFSTGLIGVANEIGDAGNMMQWTAGDAKPLAVYESGLHQAKILVLEQGQKFIDGTSSLGRLAFFGAYNFDNLNVTGQNLFVKTLEWTSAGASIDTLKIALVCTKQQCWNPADAPLRDYLHSVADEVIQIADDDPNTPWDTSSYDAIVVSPSVLPSEVAWLTSQPTGVLTVLGSTHEELLLANAGNMVVGGSTDVVIMDSSHEITQGLEEGVADLANSIGNAGNLQNWESGEAKPLAVYTSAPWQAKILIIDKDQTLVNGEAAKERRAFFGAWEFELLNQNGKALFERTLDWVAYSIPSISFVRDTSIVEHGTKITVVDPELKNGNLGETRQVEIISPLQSFNVTVQERKDGILVNENVFLTEDVGDSGNNILQVRKGDFVQVNYTALDGTELSDSTFVATDPPSQPHENRRSTIERANCDDYGGDTDGDNICNVWENGHFDPVHGAGLNINYTITGGEEVVYHYPCDFTCPHPEIPDVYVEIDYMEGHYPDEEAIENVILAFADAPVNGSGSLENTRTGIQLHLQVDEQALYHDDYLEVWGNDEPDPYGFDQIKSVYFGSKEERDRLNPDDTWWNNTGWIQKKQVFKYALFVHNMAPPRNGTSGFAEAGPGNDFIISLGNFSGFVGSTDQQEGTLMHELGHVLGLKHGGGDDINCKPNYLSVMSYSRQFSNFLERPLDFSRSQQGALFPGSGIGLLENSLNETQGLEQSEPAGLETVWGPREDKDFSGQPLDWNGDGTITNIDSTIENLNQLPGCGDSPSNQNLEGFDDWENIVFIDRNPSGFLDGFTIQDHRDQLKFRFTNLGNQISNLGPSDFKSEQDINLSETVKKYYIDFLNKLKPFVIFKQTSIVQNQLSVINSTLTSPIGGSLVKGFIKADYQTPIIMKINNLIGKPQITTNDIDELKLTITGLKPIAFGKTSVGLGDTSDSIKAKKNYEKLIERAKSLIDVGQEDAARLQLLQLNETLANDLKFTSYNLKIFEYLNSLEKSLETSTEFVPTDIHPQGKLQNSIFIRGGSLCWKNNSCFDPYVNWLPVDPAGAELTFFNNDNVPHIITIENPTVGGGTFKKLEILPGSSAPVVLNETGTYEYYSSVNGEMHGFIILDPHAVPEFGIVTTTVLIVAIGALIMILYSFRLITFQKLS